MQAQEAGDDALAAAGYARAYELTPASETGPRLLFLRASVAARLRVPEGAPALALHLCQARELLRRHAREAPEVLAEERTSLAEVEGRIAAGEDPTCSVLTPTETKPAPDPTLPGEAKPPDPRPTSTSAPGPTPAPAVAPPAARPRLARSLLIGGGVSLGVGAASFAMMGAGIGLAARASERGRDECWYAAEGCDITGGEVGQINTLGGRADTLVRVGATLGGLTALAGLTLLIVGGKLARRGRVALAPGGALVRF